MRKIWYLAKLFGRIFVLKDNPSNVPYSIALLFILVITFLASKILLYFCFIDLVDKFDNKDIINLTYSGALTIALLWVMILFAALRSALSYYNLTSRFVQTASSFVAIDCILNFIYILWLLVLFLFEVPGESYPTLLSIVLILGFILLMYWQFMVYIHMLIYSMEISLVKAGVFSLFYMLLQHNLSEIALNSVISVTKI